MLAEISNVQSGDLAPKKQQKQCDTCHYSCMKCQGPHEYDCTQCFVETAKRTNQFNQTVCVNPPENVPLEVIGAFDGNETHTFNQNKMSTEKYIFFFVYVIFIVSITIVITVMITKRLIAQFCDANKNLEKKYVYDRIAYDGSKEQQAIVIGEDGLSCDSDTEDGK